MKPANTIDRLTKDPAYEVVAQFQGDRFSYTQPWVVRHKASGTFWASIFCDEQPDRWWEVEASVKRRTKYTFTSERYDALSGRSPQDVSSDTRYRPVANLDWHRGEPHVVREIATGKLWGCTYIVRADDSDYDQSATWFAVKAEDIEQVEYRDKAKGVV